MLQFTIIYFSPLINKKEEETTFQVLFFYIVNIVEVNQFTTTKDYNCFQNSSNFFIGTNNRWRKL
jgi:hypothetical protein